MFGTSKGMSVDKTDFVVVLRNAALVGLGSAIAYLANNFTTVDLGPQTALLVPVIVMALQSLGRFVTDFTKPKE